MESLVPGTGILIARIHSDDARMNIASEEGESNTHEPRTISLPCSQPSRTPPNAGSSVAKLLDGLGYLDHNDDNLLGYLKTVSTYLRGISFTLFNVSCLEQPLTFLNVQIEIFQDDASDSRAENPKSTPVTPEVVELLKKIPERSVTDILIQHFFGEANWIYELVYSTTFLAHYNEWWSRPCQSMDDLEFAVLLLRLCAYSAQFLPSQNYTADTIQGSSLSTIREQCDATAIAISQSPTMKGIPPSMSRIHQLFFHACYLKNEGQMKESWGVLSEAIREAHELGLHLDVPKRSGNITTEYDLEMGKRTYWNLFLWDRSVSTS